MNSSDAVARQPNGRKSGLGGVLEDLLQPSRQFLKQAHTLAIHEWQLELTKAKSAVIYAVAGVPLGTIGAAVLVFMLVHLLATLGVPLWASFGLVAVLIIGLAVTLLLYAKKTASAIRPVPRETLDTIKETAIWIRQYVAGSRS